MGLSCCKPKPPPKAAQQPSQGKAAATASGTTSTDGEELRAQASKYAKLRGESYDAASATSDRTEAIKLRTKGKEFGRMMEESNAKASRAFFRHHNKDNDEWVIDLHGQFVKEALALVEEHLARMEAKRGSGGKTFTIVVGQGHHTKGPGGPKIRPAVLDDLRVRGYKPRFQDHNPGAIEIELGSARKRPTSGFAESSTEESSSAS